MGYLMFLAGAAILCAAVDGKKRIWQRLNITHGIDFRRFLLALVAGVVIVLGTIIDYTDSVQNQRFDPVVSLIIGAALLFFVWGGTELIRSGSHGRRRPIGELWREFREEEPDTWKGDET